MAVGCGRTVAFLFVFLLDFARVTTRHDGSTLKVHKSERVLHTSRRHWPPAGAPPITKHDTRPLNQAVAGATMNLMEAGMVVREPGTGTAMNLMKAGMMMEEPQLRIKELKCSNYELGTAGVGAPSVMNLMKAGMMMCELR